MVVLSNKIKCRLCILCWALAVGISSAQSSELLVFPQHVVLSRPWDRAQLRVTRGDQDLTRSVVYHTDNPNVIKVDENGGLVPQGSGETTIRVKTADRSQEAIVNVECYRQQTPVDFARDVLPLFSRYGCNAGGCHGKATGQNGFKLSLFGFDIVHDYVAVVWESRGRRISLSSPEQSLLLMKATGEVPHGGGKRFSRQSHPYSVVRAWIEAGAPPSTPQAPSLVRLEITPQEAQLGPGQNLQLVVHAVYSDHSRRDVTRIVEYASNLDVVASVDDTGWVTGGIHPGEAALMARTMGQVAVCRILRPFGPARDQLPGFVPVNLIDQHTAAKWKKLGLQPSPICDDATFLRRVTLDLNGRLPTVEECRQFLSDEAPDKRSKWIDHLLNTPDYASFFAMKWGVILRNSNLAGAERAAYAFHDWLREMLANNRPYDEFVRGIVAASGEWQDAPAINWLWQSRDDQLHQVTADTAQVFLGLRLQCAKCHHHPYERFSQEDYYGLAGFFTRLGRKSFGEPPPYFTAPQVTIGERHPLTGEQIQPKYLDGPTATFAPHEDPRHALVDWMVRSDNPFFAKALVNRYWGHLWGRGIVDQVDDMRETNPPSNPELLDALAQEFIHSHFDLKHLLRLMVNSRTYQLSSVQLPENQGDIQNYSRFYPRRLVAEVLHDAIDQACGVKTAFPNMAADARAVDLPHENFGSYFLDAFDRPRRVTACECERSTSATLAQVLLLANSDEIENKIAADQGRIAHMMQKGLSTPSMIEELYLAALSRYPTPHEIITAEAHISQSPDIRRGLEDVLWGILNSREFLFNH